MQTWNTGNDEVGGHCYSVSTDKFKALPKRFQLKKKNLHYTGYPSPVGLAYILQTGTTKWMTKITGQPLKQDSVSKIPNSINCN